MNSRHAMAVTVGTAILVAGQGCLLDMQGEWAESSLDGVADPDSMEIPGEVDDTTGDQPLEVPDDTEPSDTVLDPLADTGIDTEDTMGEPGPDLPPCDGPMTLYYIDADGDGYGDIGGGIEWCAQPAGFVDNHDDCMDTHPQVHPGQTEYFDTERGDGSFDYDCDVHQSQLYNSTTECHDWDCDGEGWYGTTVPPCGVTAPWRRCFWEWLWCNISDSDRTQLCR